MIELLKWAQRGFDQLTQAPLSCGGVAPDFTLQNQRGESVRLYDLRGRPVILVFYPADDTPTCTRQLADFEALRPKLAAADGQVLGINPGSAAAHQAFCEKLGLGFDLLVDPGARVARRFRATLGPLPRVRRTVYGITPGGRVAFADRGTPSPELVIRSLGLWDPPERPADEGVPVDDLLHVGEPTPGSGGKS